jgi:hypothetical protein
MSEFIEVRTKDDLDALDSAEILAGYMDGRDNAPEPGSDKSRSYWHGWRNGMVDGKHREIDSAQMQLVREVVGTYRGLN